MSKSENNSNSHAIIEKPPPILKVYLYTCARRRRQWWWRSLPVPLLHLFHFPFLCALLCLVFLSFNLPVAAPSLFFFSLSVLFCASSFSVLYIIYTHPCFLCLFFLHLTCAFSTSSSPVLICALSPYLVSLPWVASRSSSLHLTSPTRLSSRLFTFP